MHDARFDHFYENDYPRLVGALTLTTGDPERARDAVDEAVARAWERLRRGKTIDELGAWVRVVATNVARGRFRRAQTEERLRARMFLTIDPSDIARASAAIDVQRALMALPRRQREITVSRYFLDLSVAEIAADLGIAEGTVKSTLHSARSTLAAVLGVPDDREVSDDIT